MMAHALPRDMAIICTYDSRLTLINPLSEIRSQPDAARSALSNSLDLLLDQRLAEWALNPDGEDRNGMPLWHSMFARTDFEVMATQLEDLFGVWLSLLLPDQRQGEELSAMTERAATLASRLRAHHVTPANLSTAEINETRALLAALRKELAALQAVAPASEETGQ